MHPDCIIASTHTQRETQAHSPLPRINTRQKKRTEKKPHDELQHFEKRKENESRQKEWRREKLNENGNGATALFKNTAKQTTMNRKREEEIASLHASPKRKFKVSCVCVATKAIYMSVYKINCTHNHPGPNVRKQN